MLQSYRSVIGRTLLSYFRSKTYREQLEKVYVGEKILIGQRFPGRFPCLLNSVENFSRRSNPLQGRRSVRSTPRTHKQHPDNIIRSWIKFVYRDFFVVRCEW